MYILICNKISQEVYQCDWFVRKEVHEGKYKVKGTL